MKVVQCKLIKKVDKASVWIRLDFIRQVKNLFGYDPVQGRKETKTKYCCAQCGDVPLCMQEDIRNSCWTNWHKTVYEGLSKKKNN